MADTPSITLVTLMTYRGNPEEYSNTYHFSGDAPANDAAWKTLADAIWTTQKAIVPSTHSLVRAYGYVAGNEHSVATVDYVALGLTPVVGTLVVPSSGRVGPGDTAVVLRGLRQGKNSKGRNTYCFKYFHGAVLTGGDTVESAQKAAIVAHGAKMIDGTLPGSARWCAPQAQPITVTSAMQNVTTRTLKRRGKRPSS